MSAPGPLLYQINTRVLLHERGAELGRPATLDDLSDELLDEVAGRGFTWVWLLGIWQTGAAGQRLARANAVLRAELLQVLPDVQDQDVVSSPFAVTAYQVHEDFGGDAALERLRRRLARRGLRLLLDFVPNHLATDHPWVASHPEYFVSGTEEDLAREPRNYLRVDTRRGPMILAHGRDPHYDGWSDTVQLDHFHPGLRQAQLGVLQQIADRCDGVRCDMAMLLQPEVFQRTWGGRSHRAAEVPASAMAPFWPEAIAATRRHHPGFVFLAEVYWDLEWELQQAGFDYTYDKVLYDRLRGVAAVPVRDHLCAALSFQERSLRFLENHDEARAAAAFAPDVHRAAAVIAYLTPGLRLFQEGQREGRRHRVPMQLARRPAEPVDPSAVQFYDRLLGALTRPEVRQGSWRLRDAGPAWSENRSHLQLVAMTWALGDRRLLAAVNYGPSAAQGYLLLDWLDGADRPVLLRGLLDEVSYQRTSAALSTAGLYLDLPPWGYHLFEVTVP
jgi:glycosidase